MAFPQLSFKVSFFFCSLLLLFSVKRAVETPLRNARELPNRNPIGIDWKNPSTSKNLLNCTLYNTNGMTDWEKELMRDCPRSALGRLTFDTSTSNQLAEVGFACSKLVIYFFSIFAASVEKVIVWSTRLSKED
tara:strand:- start:861 stop:1259 length:399 start_codon:yes stop_codon:yes gene_type:complete